MKLSGSAIQAPDMMEAPIPEMDLQKSWYAEKDMRTEVRRSRSGGETNE